MAKKKSFLNRAWTQLWNVIAHKHVRAVLWGAGAMAVAFGMDYASAELIAWDPNNEVTILAGLVFARITKALNNQYGLKK